MDHRDPDDWWVSEADLWTAEQLPPYPSEPAYAEEVEPREPPTWSPPVVFWLVLSMLTTVGLAWVCRMMLEAR